MFKKLLIANRGEVAVRVARAAREMGIATVGVASEADREASWLEALDEVVPIGAAAPRESYLQMERVLQAGVQTGCSAVHPGWGFLSENPRFAALCEQHGVTFVGPSPGVMTRLGRKLEAKRTMRAAGLAGIPGSDEPLEDTEHALRLAGEVGYPVMVKAVAGGGGRGMRLCHEAGELREAFGRARAEAEAAFGDGQLYLERYISGGRHIEVQVMADAYGNAVHLGERECSIQRSHQKLIEESPSPVLDQAEREELGERAARASAAIGYVGAGTVEFLRAPDGGLWFMEMNARLQVEHSVSEMMSGLDLVQLQLRVAANEPLGFNQADVRLAGAAIECRINAEDPRRGFRPSPGLVTTFELPTDLGPGRVRVDTHLRAGDEVPPQYDSLIAKLITHHDTRAGAIETMIAALGAARVEGIETTIPLHLAVLASDEFRRGDYDTSSLPGWDSSATAED